MKKPNLYKKLGFFVGPLGLEPRLFCTKNRRVASYTMGHHRNASANLKETFVIPNKNKNFFKKNIFILYTFSSHSAFILKFAKLLDIIIH